MDLDNVMTLNICNFKISNNNTWTRLPTRREWMMSNGRVNHPPTRVGQLTNSWTKSKNYGWSHTSMDEKCDEFLQPLCSWMSNRSVMDEICHMWSQWVCLLRYSQYPQMKTNELVGKWATIIYIYIQKECCVNEVLSSWVISSKETSSTKYFTNNFWSTNVLKVCEPYMISL
jgi:hypothetical protein